MYGHVYLCNCAVLGLLISITICNIWVRKQNHSLGSHASLADIETQILRTVYESFDSKEHKSHQNILSCNWKSKGWICLQLPSGFSYLPLCNAFLLTGF